MIEVTDAHLSAARQRWEAERIERPIPVSVRFDNLSERVIVEFTNGASFMFPARALEGLEEGTVAQLAEVELLGETGLHWESLDADYTIAGLMNGIFGTKAFMEARRSSARFRSPGAGDRQTGAPARRS